jgi:hypothetical protein
LRCAIRSTIEILVATSSDPTITPSDASSIFIVATTSARKFDRAASQGAVSFVVRRGLGDPANNDDRERSMRVEAELDTAVEEKAALADRVQELQKEEQQLSSERAVLVERLANMERQSNELVAAKDFEILRLRRELRKAEFSFAGLMISVIVLVVVVLLIMHLNAG